MKPTLLITFPFHPVPALRMTQEQLKLMRIPDAKLPKEKIDLKNRLKRCMDNKFALSMCAKSAKFKLPDCDFEIIFWIETKESSRWEHPHKIKPDVDNMLKQVFDALCSSDSHIYSAKMSKFWCKPGQGRTEVWKIWG